MIEGYLQQKATWKQMVSADGYPPQPQEPGTEIKVRWEARLRMVRNAQGQEVAAEARVFCTAAVAVGDVLEYGGRNWPVISASDTPGLEGRPVFRELYV